MISIVVPFLNEEKNIPVFYTSLKKVLTREKIKHEIIFFNDGSTDDSEKIVKVLQKKDKTIHLLSFPVNRGKSEAFNIAFRYAKGEYIVTMDADLQDDPEDLPKFITKIHQGFDMVAGWRKDRKDKFYMVIPSKIWNAFTHYFWKTSIHDYNCGYKIYSAPTAQSLQLYGGMHRFIPMLLEEEGYKISEVEVSHHKRLFGKSKYGFLKIFKDWPDMFTVLFVSKFIKRPMHFFGVFGAVTLFIGMIMLIYLTFIHYVFNQAIGQRPALIIGVLFIIIGLQIFFTGLLADMLVHLTQKNWRPTMPYSEIGRKKK